jgi:hypothetical protein
MWKEVRSVGVSTMIELLKPKTFPDDQTGNLHYHQKDEDIYMQYDALL